MQRPGPIRPSHTCQRRSASGACAEVSGGSHSKEDLRDAQYAQALFNGKNVTSKPPKTEIWCMLYAQLRQADEKENRNILLSEVKLKYVDPSAQLQISVGDFLRLRTKLPIQTANSLKVNLDAPATGIAQWTETEIRQLLDQFNLARGTRPECPGGRNDAAL